MVNRIQRIEQAMIDHIQVIQSFDENLKKNMLAVVDAIVSSHRQGKRVLLMGNGGSAADAQHFSAELVGRFLKEREPLDVIALTTNSSTLTCLINDYPPEIVFARQVGAHAKQGDIVLGISTSGNSPNILRALEEAKRKGAMAIGLTGASGGAMADKCDILLKAPSTHTPYIQESHIFIIHLICELVEEAICQK